MEFVEQQIGLLVPIHASYVSAELATLAIPQTPLTFEQVLHVFEAGIETATPSGSGTYTRVYNWSTGAANTIKTYTIETGNAIAGDVNEMEYSFVQEFTVSGAATEAWMIESTWNGRQKTPTAFTGSLSVPSVEEAIFGKTQFYIDAGGGTIGSTAIVGVLKSVEINVTTGLQAVPTGDTNALAFAAVKQIPAEITYSISIELENTTGVVAAERAAYEAQTTRLIRLKCNGTSSRMFQVDFAGRHTSVQPYQNEDGNTIVTFEGEARYSSTDALFCEFTVINGVSSIP